MSKLKILFLTVVIPCLLASACAPAKTPSPLTLTASRTPQATFTLTATPSPTATSTFNPQTIATATRAPAAKCPPATPITNPDLSFLESLTDKPDTTKQKILDFLNNFGAETFQKTLQKSTIHRKNLIYIQDLTNDGLPEVVIPATNLYIFGCINKHYSILLEKDLASFGPPYAKQPEDLNHNGIPDIILGLGMWTQGGRAYDVVEWTGKSFSSLIGTEYPPIWLEANGNMHFEDLNRDSLKELIVDKGLPVSMHSDGLPARNKRTVYQWNGSIYNPVTSEYDPAEYRFQAIQDADAASTKAAYDKAFQLYQQSILDEKLLPYSPEIAAYIKEITLFSRWSEKGTPTPTPASPDLSEYPQLAAYAW